MLALGFEVGIVSTVAGIWNIIGWSAVFKFQDLINISISFWFKEMVQAVYIARCFFLYSS